jgi:hypothetical protein
MCQSGITEERGLRGSGGSGRGNRTNIILIIEIYINNIIGTDGRPIIAKKASETGKQKKPLLLYRFVSPQAKSKAKELHWIAYGHGMYCFSRHPL